MDSAIEQARINPVDEITAKTDTRNILQNAHKQGQIRDFEDVFIVDIDAYCNFVAISVFSSCPLNNKLLRFPNGSPFS